MYLFIYTYIYTHIATYCLKHENSVDYDSSRTKTEHLLQWKTKALSFSRTERTGTQFVSQWSMQNILWFKGLKRAFRLWKIIIIIHVHLQEGPEGVSGVSLALVLRKIMEQTTLGTITWQVSQEIWPGQHRFSLKLSHRKYRLHIREKILHQKDC